MVFMVSEIFLKKRLYLTALHNHFIIYHKISVRTESPGRQETDASRILSFHITERPCIAGNEGDKVDECGRRNAHVLPEIRNQKPETKVAST